jgi:hypothetical protein
MHASHDEAGAVVITPTYITILMLGMAKHKTDEENSNTNKVEGEMGSIAAGCGGAAPRTLTARSRRGPASRRPPKMLD